MILFHPIYMAGLSLARTGRAECKSCIAGLRQYSIAYGYLWDSADELERVYQSSMSATHKDANPLDGLGLELWLPPYPPVNQNTLVSDQSSGWATSEISAQQVSLAIQYERFQLAHVSSCLMVPLPSSLSWCYWRALRSTASDSGGIMLHWTNQDQLSRPTLLYHQK